MFYEAGQALIEIRKDNLYNDAGFETFDAYCKAKWDFTKSYANHLIASTVVVDNISSVATQVAGPTMEAQARPLARLTPEKQREVWKEAVDTAPDGKVTATHVAKVVKPKPPAF